MKVTHSSIRRLALAFAISLSGFAGGLGCSDNDSVTPSTPADIIYTNANFFTMNDDQPQAEAVAVSSGEIVAVGTEAQVLTFQGPNTQMIDLEGATVFPGFIDTHSHTIGYAFFNDPKKWLDVSSINFYFKPLPNDPRCTDPTDPQVCFIPVTNQDEVLARIQAEVDKDPNSDKPVLAFGYANGRLGSTQNCNGLGFACPNFQGDNPTALEALNNISNTRPIAVAASTGHFLFVNSPALAQANICGTTGSNPNTCHSPISNAAYETNLAETGVLVEDLALYGTGVFQEEILKEDPASTFELLKKGVNLYAQHGFTTIQEGAAENFQVEIYDIMTQDPDFPVNAIMLAYTGQQNFQNAVDTANKVREMSETNPRIMVGGIKTFADGATPSYTSAMINPFYEVYPPLMDPWYGVADFTEAQLSAQIAAAHAAGFPIAIHMNGDQGVKNALAAMQANHDPDIRDLAIHMQVSHPEDYQVVKELNAQVTFLIADLYYFGLPYCQQVLGPDTTEELVSPIGEAIEAGIPFRLHSDSPVTPPDPLFMIWSAVTRKVQQPPWLPNQDPNACPVVSGADQTITIAQGIKAFTIDSASFYGLEDQIGSLEVGKKADMVLLSDNPLNMEANPDALAAIRTLGTILQGKLFENPNADQTPIWPD